MLKRLVFDLDNTLLPWEDEYNSWLSKTFDEFNILYDDNIIKQFHIILEEYKENCKHFNKIDIVRYINERTHLNLPDNFINAGMKHLISLSTDKVLDEVIETLEYLKTRYDMVVLTNWFTDSQKERLKKAGLIDYFSHIYGADDLPLKPDEKAFKQVFDNFKASECMMIGDEIIKDIKGAYQCGMQVLLYDPQYKHLNPTYPTFHQFKNLKTIL